MNRVLEDMTKKHSVEHAQLQDAIKRLTAGLTANKSTNSQSEDISKILRLVTWLVDASPHASSLRREHGYK